MKVKICDICGNIMHDKSHDIIYLKKHFGSYKKIDICIDCSLVIQSMCDNAKKKKNS